MSLTKVSYSMIAGASANILDFGAVSGSDSTTAIQAAINSGAASIVYPPGRYTVGPLTLASNQKHIGIGGVLVSTNTGVNMMSGVSVSNVFFTDLIFESTDVAVSCIALRGTLSPASNCNNIEVNGCSCTGGIQLFSTYQPTGSTYDTITTAMLSDNIRVINNSVIGTSATQSGAGIGAIALYYAADCVVANNTIISQKHGIFLWGGSGSSSPGDSAITNQRKCFRNSVTGNIIRNIGGGGIVGNMCAETSVTGNVIETCADVGIDFESCFTCVASGNYVSDCINGCLVTYNVIHGILFSGNNCTQTVANRNIVMHNNTVSPAVATVRDVTYVGNVFECAASITGSQGICFVSDTSIDLTITNAIQNIVCSNNTFINCCIRHRGDTIRQASYIGNTFIYAYTVGIAFNALESIAAGGGVTISSNIFNTLAAPTASTNCIYVSSYSFANQIVNVIQNNSMIAAASTTWPCAIKCVDAGGTQSTFYTISNNTFNATTGISSTTTTTKLKAINNSDSLGVPYPYFTSPSTYPTETFWQVGQIAYASAGAASAGYIGAVCTVAGTTWKTFGVIS